MWKSDHNDVLTLLVDINLTKTKTNGFNLFFNLMYVFTLSRPGTHSL